MTTFPTTRPGGLAATDPHRDMTGLQARTMRQVTSFAATLPRGSRSVLGAIGSAMWPRALLVAFALLLILVILPAVLGGAGIQAAAPI